MAMQNARYVDIDDLKVGDIIVQIHYMGGSLRASGGMTPAKTRGNKSITYSTITEVGEVKEHAGRRYKHFTADMVTDSGQENPNHKFMIPFPSNVRAIVK